MCAPGFVTDATDGVEQTEFKCINIIEERQPAVSVFAYAYTLHIGKGAVWQKRFHLGFMVSSAIAYTLGMYLL